MPKHRARCQCGQLSVETEKDPEFVVLCNCKACQKRTGAPYGVGGYFQLADLMIQGNKKDWQRTAESGRALTNHFCPDCGTNLYWTLEMRPGMAGVAVGSFDAPLPEPARAIWAQEKHDWVDFPGHWPVYDKAVPT